MTDIRGFLGEEKVHKLVLETALRHSVLAQYQQPVVLTEEELHEIFSKIEHRVYYTVEAPTFDLTEIVNNKVTTRMVSCGTMASDTIQGLVDIILDNSKDKYFIYYTVSVSELSGVRQYSIRGAFFDDPIMKRDNTINIILGESDI